MAAYDASKTSHADLGAQAPLSKRIGQLFGSQPAAGASGPALDHGLLPAKDGKVVLAGYRVPMAAAVVGIAAVAALLLNRKTRLPVLAAVTTAWSYLNKKPLTPATGQVGRSSSRP